MIENTQRDLNIALINELAIIFDKMGIDTQAVLEAAGSKWNFLPFRPGLVGGHCIGVDPYYLTHKAEAIGHHPQIILAGRRLNDGMSGYVVARLVKEMARKHMPINGAQILIMGLSFKENCPDLRNTRVIDIIVELKDYGCIVDVYDPCVIIDEARREYGIVPISRPRPDTYDVIILAVAHEAFKALRADGIRALGKNNSLIYDLKYMLSSSEADLRL